MLNFRLPEAVLLLLILGNVIVAASVTENLPLAEDWHFVSQLYQPEKSASIGDFLWAQNNEHRDPLARLLLLSTVGATKDFRAGVVLSLLSLTIVAGLFVRHARASGMGVLAVFVPVLLLHLGHWPNLFWGWQFTFVLSVFLVSMVLYLAFEEGRTKRPTAGWLVFVPVILLPLGGSLGLAFAPFAVLWLLLRSRSDERVSRPATLTVAIATVALAAIYFVGWSRPEWYAAGEAAADGPLSDVTAALKILSLGVGLGGLRVWPLYSLIVLGAGAWVATLLLIRETGADRQRNQGLAVLGAGCFALPILIGLGRSSQMDQPIPLRYCLVASLPWLWTFLASLQVESPQLESHGGSRLRAGLLACLLVVLPLTVRSGVQWGSWYRSGALAVERDVASGLSSSQIADRHGEFLVHWWDSRALQAGIDQLSERKIGVFGRMGRQP